MIRAIPTTYNGIEFRSRVEANVAKLFDACRVEWVYEQESFDADGVWYLPDFWLPKAKQFVEVKGQADDPSVAKCVRLAHALQVKDGAEDESEQGRPARVVVLAPPFVMLKMENTLWGGHPTGANVVCGIGFNGVEQVDAGLVVCGACRVPFFMTSEGAWVCSACGEPGKHYHNEVAVWAEHKRGTTTYERVAP